MGRGHHTYILIDLPNIINTFYYPNRSFFKPEYLEVLFRRYLRQNPHFNIHIFTTPYYSRVNIHIAQVLNKYWNITLHVHRQKVPGRGRAYVWEDIDQVLIDYLEEMRNDIDDINRIILFGADWVYEKPLFKFGRLKIPLTCIYHAGKRPHVFQKFQSLRKRYGKGHVKEHIYTNYDLLRGLL